MPQLDISVWPPQLVWLAISFALLYFIVSRIIIPRTGGVISLRKSTIASDLASAQRNKVDSEAALKAYEASLADAKSKAQATSLAARNKLAAEADAARTQLETTLKANAADADRKISSAKAKAVASIDAVAADIAATIVEKLTGTKVATAAVASAVSKAKR